MEMHISLVFVVAVLCCLGVSRAADDFYTITGQFVETSADPAHGLQDGVVRGDFYYLYNKSDAKSSRLRLVYKFPDMSVTNLYKYDENALFSWCDQCTGAQFEFEADPWWFDSSVYVEDTIVDSGTWYRHENAASKGHVSRILLSKNYPGPSDGLLSIEFADKRILNFTNVNANDPLSPDDAVFGLDAGVECPEATCPLYADIVFVLDNSGSVDDNEWGQSVDFVLEFVKSFTLGPDSVLAGLVHFADEWRWCSDFSEAAVLVPLSDTTFVNETKKWRTRPASCGGTEQALGLELARQMIDPKNNKRTRTHNGKTIRPAPVIIAVTDGYDFYPENVRNKANVLKNNYGAFVVEVGVGNSVDVNFLKSVASKFGEHDDTPAYFHTSNYAGLNNIVDQIFRPICQLGSGACGPYCKGFCGCGKCFCPECDPNYPDTCKVVKCEEGTNHSSATGCVVMNDPCRPTSNDKCIYRACNGTIPRGVEGHCYDADEPCAPNGGVLKDCQVRNCDPSFGCLTPTDNHTYCDEMHNEAGLCEVWKCSGDKPGDGCYLYRNVTAECIANLDKYTCRESHCDKDTGMCTPVVDRCSAHDDKCNIQVCDMSTDQVSGCQERDNPEGRPSDAEFKCLKNYECDGALGWFYENVTAEDCRQEFAAKGIYNDEWFKCKRFYCSVAKGGCTYEEVLNCPTVCKDDVVAKCKAKTMKRTDAACEAYLYCRAKEVDGKLEPECVYDTVDCTAVGGCMRGQCDVDSGQCYNTPFDNPYARLDVNNKCYESYCTADGNWAVRMRPLVEENINKYKNSECFTYTCDNATGLVKHPLCVTSDCIERRCDKTEMRCEVLTEGCAGLAGTVCTEFACVDGICTEVPVSPPPDVLARLEPELTPCTEPKCNPDDGSWSIGQKDAPIEFQRDNEECYFAPCSRTVCDDKTGKWLCIENGICAPETERISCWEFDCKVLYDEETYETFGFCTDLGPKDCSKVLDMEGYTCFSAECLPSRGGCYRRLFPNAYVDVCGNCVRDGEGSGLTSSEEMECMEGAGAPILPTVLTAGIIALIVIAAIVGAAILAASSILGTKVLLDRARAADNQSAHVNPLFEDNDQEMSNPAYIGDQ